MSIVNLSAYRFTPLQDLSILQSDLTARCDALGIKGTILLSLEGINLTVAGEEAATDALVLYLESIPSFQALPYKVSRSDFIPFKRLKVKIKDEIITFKQTDIAPANHTVEHLSPATLKAWLDQGKDIVILDTRNDYEIPYGAFENSLVLGIDNFTELPEKTATLLPTLKNTTIVTVCTGGVRCEKVGPLMEKQGFTSVYQLDGGILNYFNECGGAHYRGGCFVFDDRVSVEPVTKESM